MPLAKPALVDVDERRAWIVVGLLTYVIFSSAHLLLEAHGHWAEGVGDRVLFRSFVLAVLMMLLLGARVCYLACRRSPVMWQRFALAVVLFLQLAAAGGVAGLFLLSMRL